MAGFEGYPLGPFLVIQHVVVMSGGAFRMRKGMLAKLWLCNPHRAQLVG